MSNRLVDATDDYRINALLGTAKWGSEDVGSAVEISYSYPSGSAYWEYFEETDAGWYGLSSSQRPPFETALSRWSDVANITFTQVPDGAQYGDIRIAYSYNVGDDSAAYAYLPGGGVLNGDGTIEPAAQNGDIWLNPALTDLSEGTDGFFTLMHEIGHSLGLKHSFEARGDEFPALPDAEEDTSRTIMSYTDTRAAGYTFESSSNNQYTATVVKPSTPMLYDVLAIQHLYGANMDTRSGDDVYKFETSGTLMTIWDGGGNDTIDLSNQKIGTWLDLNDGTYSDVGLRQLLFSADPEAADDNLAIAFGAEIENAIGTSYDDRIQGNELDNVLTGGAGDDRLYGGDGEDTAVLAGYQGDYSFSQENDVIIVEGMDGTDRLHGIENVQFDNETVAVADLPILPDAISAAPTSKDEVNLTPDEGDTAYFLLELSEAIDSVASVQYTTRDGTAKAGEDYEETTGTATLQAGQTFLAIQVELIDDGVNEANEYFELVVTDPVGGTFGGDQVELVAQRIIIDNDG